MSNQRRSMGDDFGVLLKRYREERGMTLKELSERSGVTQSYISRLETGQRRRPTSIVLEDLSVALEIDPFILTGIEYWKKIEEPIEMESILFIHDVSFNGKVLDVEEKDILLEILQLSMNADCKQETITEELLQIGNKIAQLKGVI